jgi:hypothetical protein
MLFKPIESAYISKQKKANGVDNKNKCMLFQIEGQLICLFFVQQKERQK